MWLLDMIRARRRNRPEQLIREWTQSLMGDFVVDEQGIMHVCSSQVADYVTRIHAELDELKDILGTEQAAAEWIAVADRLPPAGVWVQTKREGENGWNICRVDHHWSDEVWSEYGSGRDTVTHHSFSAPTHWRTLLR